MPSSVTDNNYNCSFCNKVQNQVKRLIAGPDRVFICDECVELCGQIISQDANAGSKGQSSGLSRPEVNPKWLHEKLNEYVIGQEQAKKVLSVAVYNHYKRIWANTNKDEVELEKANILMLGPAGSGKTLLAQTLARILEVPFAIADATSLTEAGYVGEDVENILLRLIQAADFDIAKAEQGIIYIDEIDKIARKNPNPSITRDVSGEGVQQALLKIIEGCVANVPPQGGRKHPHQEFLQIKTDNILFMCGGAFEGLKDILSKRVMVGNSTIGFAKSTENTGSLDENNLFGMANSDDLLNYGFIPELIGRLPVFVGLNGLTEKDLVRVLTEPKNALTKQYQFSFELDGVDLSFTDSALEVASKKAIELSTGARGLRSILEETLLDVTYDISSMKDVERCIVTDKTIMKQEGVKIVKKRVSSNPPITQVSDSTDVDSAQTA